MEPRGGRVIFPAVTPVMQMASIKGQNKWLANFPRLGTCENADLLIGTRISTGGDLRERSPIGVLLQRGLNCGTRDLDWLAETYGHIRCRDIGVCRDVAHLRGRCRRCWCRGWTFVGGGASKIQAKYDAGGH